MTETPKNTRFRYHSDPGHGWLEVGIEDIKDVGLRPGLFSSCSYWQGTRYYLEEDADASLFVAAYEAKFGQKPAFEELVERFRDSPIRSMRHTAGLEYSWEGWKRMMAVYERAIAVRQEVGA